MSTVELRVVVGTTDQRDNAHDRLEALVRRVLELALGEQVYVEQVKP